MKDFKLKFQSKEICYTVLGQYIKENVLTSQDLITFLEIGVIYDEDANSTLEVPLPAIPRDGYFVLVRDMNARTLFSIDSQYITNESIPYAFAGNLPVPEKVTNGQFRDAIVLAGISIASVNDAIQNIPDPLQKQLAINRWEYGNHIERNHPMILAMAPQFGLTDDQVDEIFRLADSLG